MATTREGGAGGVKEKDGKRGNSSSNHQIKKPTTKPLSSSSSSAQRGVPNNLKPKLEPSSSSRISRIFNSSSASAAATATKKLASVTRTQLPADKPPSSTSPPTALRFPTTTITRDLKTSRATPSTEPKTSIKLGTKRSFSALSASRSTKPAATTPSIRRSPSNKASPSSSIGHRKKGVKPTSPKSAASDTSVELHEAREKDPLDHMIGTGRDQLGIMDGDEVQSLHDISDMLGDDDQLGDPVMVVQGVVIESETADCQAVNDQVGEEGQEIEAQEQEEDEPQESVESADEVEKEGAEEVLMEEEELTKVEEKHVVVKVEGSSGEGNKDEMEVAAQVVKTERPAKHLIQSGSKKEIQAYNDVIEETVSKLMENRRNRVRALAGAFETVISLDSK